MQPVRFRCDVFHKATTFATARHKFSTICQLCKWTLEQFVHIIYTFHKILEFPFKYVDIELFNCHIVSNTICNQVQLFFYWCTHCWKHKLHVYLKQKHIYEIKNRIPEVKLELFLLKVFLISYKKTKGLKTTMAVVNLLFKYRKEVSEKKKNEWIVIPEVVCRLYLWDILYQCFALMQFFSTVYCLLCP